MMLKLRGGIYRLRGKKQDKKKELNQYVSGTLVTIKIFYQQSLIYPEYKCV
jgi:hypothetical protein